MNTPPVFWPFAWYSMWLDMVLSPWRKTVEVAPPPAGTALGVAPMNPAAAAGLDPVGAADIGTSATELS